MKENPTYYANIPANVRYSNLKPNAKLLYGEITALSNKLGYCFASNSYFAELYGVSKNTVSRWIGDLNKLGFITVQIERNSNNQITKRIIGIDKKVDTPIDKKGKDNNTRINTTSNNISIRQREFQEEVMKSDYKTDMCYNFIDYWCEPNKSNTKMKFELCQTWSMKLRLKTWAKNQKKWEKPTMSKIDIQLNEYQKGKKLL